MRLQPGAAGVAALHVVQDHRDERRPADEERADHRGGAEDAGQQAERVQAVDACVHVMSDAVRVSSVVVQPYDE